jgi:hypothetical protein
MNTKTVIAKYVLYSTFTIPDTVTEYQIHWDNLTYTDAEGNEVELEPTQDCKEDHEVYHRPADTWIEDEEGGEEPPIGFYTECEGKTHEELVQMIWHRMSELEKAEVTKECKDDEEEQGDSE